MASTFLQTTLPPFGSQHASPNHTTFKKREKPSQQQRYADLTFLSKQPNHFHDLIEFRQRLTQEKQREDVEASRGQQLIIDATKQIEDSQKLAKRQEDFNKLVDWVKKEAMDAAKKYAKEKTGIPF